MGFGRFPPEIYLVIFSQLIPTRHPLSNGIPLETKDALVQLCMTSQTFRAIATPHLYANIRILYKQVKLLASMFITTTSPRPSVHSLAVTHNPDHIKPLKDRLIQDICALFACLGSTTDNIAPLRRLYIQQSSFVTWVRKPGFEGDEVNGQLLELKEIMQLLPDLTDIGCVPTPYCHAEPVYPNLERLIVEDCFYCILHIERVFQLPRVKSVFSSSGAFFGDDWDKMTEIMPTKEPSQRPSFIFRITPGDPSGSIESHKVIVGRGCEANVFKVEYETTDLWTVVVEKCLDGSIWDQGQYYESA